MRATIPYIEQKFEEFNRLCFAGELPKLPIRLSDAKTFLGKVVYKKRTLPDGRVEKYDFCLRINTRIDLSEQEVEDTILHEMIHYHIGVNQLKDTSSHGAVFVSIMNHINAKYGRHITISHRGSAEQNEEGVDKRPKWHVIAVVTFNDERVGIKVLPRIVERITYYYNNVSANKKVKDVQLFLCNNPYFNRYPNSSALKVFFVDRETIEAELQGTEKLECDGKNIIRNKQ
ncbi:MAG: SprT-like domain-containing protein [Muribaculaceae bacterium]|nr:SprT-like domain-containing protein [Muribaculaceae bacterium]